MRNVYLHGELGKRFGKKWELEVSSPAEAISALFANKPEIEKYIIQKEKDNVIYGVRRSNSKAITDPEDFKLKTKKDIHVFSFTPRIWRLHNVACNYRNNNCSKHFCK